MTVLTIDFSRREVWVEGKKVDLRPTEYRLLYHLVQNAGWVNTHEQLLSKVWGFEYQDEPHYVRLYVNYLRKKLEEDPSNPKYILTERGVGYRFVDYRRDQEKDRIKHPATSHRPRKKNHKQLADDLEQSSASSSGLRRITTISLGWDYGIPCHPGHSSIYSLHLTIGVMKCPSNGFY